MSSSSRASPVKWGIVVIIVSLAAYYAVYVLPRGELGQAEQWRVLQAVEYDHRASSVTAEPKLLQNAAGSDLSALGLPTGQKTSPFTWILLNSDSGDDYGPIKMLPQGQSFTISCREIDDVSAKVVIEPAVSAYLKSHCVR
ncbi:hypothetical protein ACL9RI_27450 [Janthinobacterium sp. Mn2066]|uniref:hypothetical protein n=1 Tax=Janthinobacterium sp. Mn2066 TaxID=3395264 RepID=UPI003BE7341E